MAGGKLVLVEVTKVTVMIPTYVLVAILCEGNHSAQDRIPKASCMGQTREWETTEAHVEHAGSSFPTARQQHLQHPQLASCLGVPPVLREPAAPDHLVDNV